MFTGIIEGIGKIKEIRTLGKARQVFIQAPFDLTKDKIGDSIAINGCCLTITSKKKNVFSADLSPETLSCTTLKNLKVKEGVNLERALKLSDRVGGHLIQGHVDGIVTLIGRKDLKTQGKKYLILEFATPKSLKKYFIQKGSIAIDGVSLTINAIDSKKLSVCLIPHTQIKTILSDKKVGDSVNIEVDLMAKYLENFIQAKEIK